MPDLRSAYADIITSGMHLFLLAFALRFNDRRVWLGTLSVVAVISFFVWLSANRRRLAIDDHPTARVASAPQGYVELNGTCRMPPGNRPVSLRADELALGVGHAWFRYRVDERNGRGKWSLVRTGRSEQGFMLDDGTGQCYVDPEDAEVMTAHKRVWYEGDYRYTEWFIVPNDELYAIGDFKTVSGGGYGGVTDADMRTLLADWKRDQAGLLERFDSNGDKQVDADEWESAREAARKTLEERRRDEATQPGVHLMTAPRDGRLFLISNLEPRKMARRYLLWAWFHLAVFVAAGAGAVAVVTRGITLGYSGRFP